MDYKERLIKFKKEGYGKDKELYKALADGQHPHTLFITCSDSRIDPQSLLQAKPGELFQVRNVANLVPPMEEQEVASGTVSAVEYAVQVLGVSDVVVCGHSNCGGCQAAITPPANAEEMPALMHWLQALTPLAEEVRQKCPGEGAGEQAEILEQLSVIRQLQNLLTYPYIQERVADGKLALHGWHYQIETGEVKAYNSNTEQFEKMD